MIHLRRLHSSRGQLLYLLFLMIVCLFLTCCNSTKPTRNQRPSVNAGEDQTTTLSDTAKLTGVVSDDGLPTGSTLAISWSKVSGLGSVTFNTANLNGIATDDGLPIGGVLTVNWSTVSGPDIVSFGNANATATIATFSVAGTYLLRLSANDTQLASSDDVTITVEPAVSVEAPAIDTTVATTLAAASEFLYTGPNPVQTGVAPGTIKAGRVAVVRGKVINRDGDPVSGVRITVVNNPAFGQTMSRSDGMFDMAVNGGGTLTLRYQKAGYLPSQRQVRAPWQDFALLDDVALTPRDAQVTPITLGAGAPIQVARGSAQTDVDGTRQATVLFPAGTTAGLVQPDGTTLPATTLNVRLTEYTVGQNGPRAMPALLPPTSAYTYAVELSADEAVAKVNGRDVVFNQPVILYVENFLDIPVGRFTILIHIKPGPSSLAGFSGSAGAFSNPHNDFPLHCTDRIHKTQRNRRLKDWDVFYNFGMLKQNGLTLDEAIVHEINGHITRAQIPSENWEGEKRASDIQNEYRAIFGKSPYK